MFALAAPSCTPALSLRVGPRPAVLHMKTPTLAPVYLDNEPVSLMGDPKPQVSKVIAATGKRPEKFDIKLLHSQTDTEGKQIDLDYVIDRTEEPAKPIYLTCVEKDTQEGELGAEGAEGGLSGKSGFGSGSSYGSQKGGSNVGGSGQGNQGFGSSGKPPHQGTSTQTQGGKPGLSGEEPEGNDWPVQGKSGKGGSSGGRSTEDLE